MRIQSDLQLDLQSDLQLDLCLYFINTVSPLSRDVVSLVTFVSNESYIPQVSLIVRDSTVSNF